MQTRTSLNGAALPMAGALLGWLAPSVRLATPVQAEDQPAASAELDRTVRRCSPWPTSTCAGSSVTWPDA